MAVTRSNSCCRLFARWGSSARLDSRNMLTCTLHGFQLDKVYHGFWHACVFFVIAGGQADGACWADGKADDTSRGQLDAAVEAPTARLAASERGRGRQNGKGKRSTWLTCGACSGRCSAEQHRAICVPNW